MKQSENKECKHLLSEIDVGVEVEVLDIKIKNQLLKRRLLEMGVIKGSLLKIKQKAPLGSPVSFQVRGCELGLRLDELKTIVVRVRK